MEESNFPRFKLSQKREEEEEEERLKEKEERDVDDFSATFGATLSRGRGKAKLRESDSFEERPLLLNFTEKEDRNRKKKL